jgi:hypothetical protein
MVIFKSKNLMVKLNIKITKKIMFIKEIGSIIKKVVEVYKRQN